MMLKSNNLIFNQQIDCMNYQLSKFCVNNLNYNESNKNKIKKKEKKRQTNLSEVTILISMK